MECLIQLQQLLEIIHNYNDTKERLDKAEKVCQEVKFRFPSSVEQFDKDHFEPYIERKCGKVPIKGKLNPIKECLRFSNRYSLEKEQYDEERKEAISQYYKEYSEERKKLKDEDEQRKELAKKEANQDFNEIKCSLQQAKNELDSNKTVADIFKTAEKVEKLISYFVEGRVSDMKEAINLWYEEDHRESIEEYARRQCEAAEDVAESARQAAESASEAAQSAQHAADSASEAADEARRAREAAEDARDEVRNSNNNY